MSIFYLKVIEGEGESRWLLESHPPIGWNRTLVGAKPAERHERHRESAQSRSRSTRKERRVDRAQERRVLGSALVVVRARAVSVRSPATVHVAVDGVDEVVARIRRRRGGRRGHGATVRRVAASARGTATLRGTQSIEFEPDRHRVLELPKRERSIQTRKKDAVVIPAVDTVLDRSVDELNQAKTLRARAAARRHGEREERETQVSTYVKVLLHLRLVTLLTDEIVFVVRTVARRLF